MRFERWAMATLLTAAGILAGIAPRARAQAVAQADSAAIAKADSLMALIPRYLFLPVYENRINSDVNGVGMTNDFHTTLTTPWKSFLTFQLNKDEKNYRLQNRLEDNKKMVATLVHPLRSDLNASVTYLDSRVFNRSIAVGGGVQDFIVNDLSVSSGASYIRKFTNDMRVDANLSGSAANGERAFKTDQTLAGGLFGGVAYELMNDRITLEGRGGARQSKSKSTTDVSNFGDLGASEDSLVARAKFAVADSIRFGVDYSDYHGDRAFADQARGSLGGQLGGAENVFEETEIHDTRNTTLTMDSNVPAVNVHLTLAAFHDENVFDYAIQKERFSRTIGDGFRGSVNYVFPWNTIATAGFEGGSTLRDLGPQSVSSLTDKRKLFRMGLSHQISPTFSVNLTGSTQIVQSFYLDYAQNPRDRDQVDTSVNFKITSQPFKPIFATIDVAYSASDVVNIDSTQSSGNRTRSLYELRPSFTYTMNQWLAITQTYGLVIEYTDFDYKASDNFLDRNLTFSNTFTFKPMTHVDFRLDYTLHLHDTGSYLPDATGTELLEVQSEDRRDRMSLHVDYSVGEHVNVFGENTYNRFEDHDIASDTRNVTTDGQIRGGATGNYDWGKGRKLSFLMARVKRFSKFGAEAEKNYWEARSEFSYPF